MTTKKIRSGLKLLKTLLSLVCINYTYNVFYYNILHMYIMYFYYNLCLDYHRSIRSFFSKISATQYWFCNIVGQEEQLESHDICVCTCTHCSSLTCLTAMPTKQKAVN